MTTTTKTYRVEFKPYREPMEIHAPDAASAIEHASAFEPDHEVSAVYLKVSDGLTIDEPVVTPLAPRAIWPANTARLLVGTIKEISTWARTASPGDSELFFTAGPVQSSVRFRVTYGEVDAVRACGKLGFVDIKASK